MPNINLGDIDTYYEDWGEGDPILFIHGLGSSTRDWEYQLPTFSKRYRCICYDVRGHGQTTRAPGPYSLSRFAGDTKALIDTLDLGPLHVIGVSMGGMIAFQLGVDHPELCRSLTICNAGPELLLPGLRDKAMLAVRLFVVRVLGMRAIGKRLAGEMFPGHGQSVIRKLVESRWAENDQGCYLDSIRALVGWSVADRLTAIKCPVLIIRGAGDKTPMSVSKTHLAAMPGSRKVQIENSLHATPVDQSGAFNRHVLEFLEELSP